MNKLISSFLVLVLAVVSLSVAAPALAWEGCQDGPSLNQLQGKTDGPEKDCTPEVVPCGTVYEYTKDKDFKNDVVNIDLSSQNKVVIVTTGWTLNEVKLDVKDDNQSGLNVYPVENGVPFDPNPGKEIEKVYVRVTKDCTQVCNDKEATNYEELKEGETVANNELCEYPTPEEPPVATPSAPVKTTELPKTGNFNFALTALIAAGLIVTGGVLKFKARKG